MNSSFSSAFFFICRFESRFSGRSDSRFRGPAQSLPQQQARANDELPPADPLILDLIAQDTMRTINIDGVPREIRFYGDTAVVMLAWDDPREIGFQGGARTVTFDDRESVLCSLNDSYRECIVDGSTHRLVFNIFIVTFLTSLLLWVLFSMVPDYSIKCILLLFIADI
jgi:hypothetical protein